MKKLIEQVEGEGLEGLLGEVVVVYCVNYIYAGKLLGVNEHDIKLGDPRLVYDTGEHSSKKWADAQTLPAKHWYVRVSAIESYAAVEKE